MEDRGASQAPFIKVSARVAWPRTLAKRPLVPLHRIHATSLALRAPYAGCSSFLGPSILDGEIHPDSFRSQPDALLLVHSHAGVVSLEKCGVLPLRPEILHELIGLGRRERVGAFVCEALA